MKSAIALFLLPFLFVACGDDSPDVPEEDAVRNTFTYYKRAILAESGAEAFQWVDAKTVAYYDRILSLAKSADSVTVRGLGLQDRFMVLLIRHGIPKENVLAMNASTLFTYAVENNMLGENGIGDLEIGEVKAEGDAATGTILLRGKPSAMYFRFNKEGGLWKIDLTSLFGAAGSDFQNLVAESGESEDSIMARLLEYQNDRKPGPEIWQPMDSGLGK